jgi:hypothetical protein
MQCAEVLRVDASSGLLANNWFSGLPILISFVSDDPFPRCAHVRETYLPVVAEGRSLLVNFRLALSHLSPPSERIRCMMGRNKQATLGLLSIFAKPIFVASTRPEYNVLRRVPPSFRLLLPKLRINQGINHLRTPSLPRESRTTAVPPIGPLHISSFQVSWTARCMPLGPLKGSRCIPPRNNKSNFEQP